MSPPRLLPLLAVAGAGLLTIKALGLAGAIPDLLQTPQALAEAVAPKAPRPGKGVSQLSEAEAPKPGDASVLGPAAAPRPPAPVCAQSPAELAKEAGLSPAELTVLQSLGTRRGQLDAREAALDGQLQLLVAAEAKVDAKLKGLREIEAQMQALMGQVDAQTQAEVDRLTIVYAKMKPRDAGAIMAQLDDKVRIPVAAQLSQTKPAVLAAILSNMGTQDAKKLTETLARRFQTAKEAAAAVANGTAPAVAAAGSPTAAKPGVKTAAAPEATPPDPAAADAKPAAAPAAKPRTKKPLQVARAAPRKAKAAAAKPAAPPAEKPADAKASEAKPAEARPADKVAAAKPAPEKPPSSPPSAPAAEKPKA